MPAARSGRLQRILSWLGRKDRRPGNTDAVDWAPGDMAQNVGASRWVDLWDNPAPGPAPGDVYRVVEVRLTIDPRFGGYGCFLVLSHFSTRLYVARNFRKVTPRADAARAADAAFVGQIKGRTLPSPPALSIAARLKRILS